MKPTFLFIALFLLSTTAVAAPISSPRTPNLESASSGAVQGLGATKSSTNEGGRTGTAATQQAPEKQEGKLIIDVEGMLTGGAIGGLATGAVAAASTGITIFTVVAVIGNAVSGIFGGRRQTPWLDATIYGGVVGAAAGIAFAAPGALVGGIVGSGAFEE